MYKQRLFGLALLGALALGCGNNTSAGQDMSASKDMAMKPADLATGPDLATPAPDMASPTYTIQVGQGGQTFTPKTMTIKVGDTIMWVWASSGHNVVSAASAVLAAAGTSDGRFCNDNNQTCGSAPTKNAGTTYSFKFTTAGTYDYFCKPHAAAGMTGTITVQ